MIDWVMIGFYTVMLLLGVWQLYRVYGFYKWDKKAKILPDSTCCNLLWGIFWRGFDIDINNFYDGNY